ncbi:Cytidylate kinase [archaeon GW2011_AR15]|nr:Cytidylate kinase [archaeon GW2011_AR15]MBS3104173.1 cytidylate kinase family protein [Candidatus Woesearchaeota archaeon]
MKIAISGKAGTGKSSVAKLLAGKLKYRHYSMGDIQREIAKKKGISIAELGELEKTDPGIDNMIDERQREIGRREGDFVIDSWLSAYFIPDAYRIFLDGNLEERAKRITKTREAESHRTIEEAAASIRQREQTNRKRWMKFYGFDFLDMKNYDLVIDTTGKGLDEVFGIIYKNIKDKKYL